MVFSCCVLLVFVRLLVLGVADILCRIGNNVVEKDENLAQVLNLKNAVCMLTTAAMYVVIVVIVVVVVIVVYFI